MQGFCILIKRVRVINNTASKGKINPVVVYNRGPYGNGKIHAVMKTYVSYGSCINMSPVGFELINYLHCPYLWTTGDRSAREGCLKEVYLITPFFKPALYNAHKMIYIF